MKKELSKRIFAREEPSNFVGRDAELEFLLKPQSRSVAVLATPAAGSSELLRQAFDRLFDAGGVIPVYFEIAASDATPRGCALRFLREFLLQTVAFRRRDAGIIGSSPDICEIAQLAMPEDGYWIDRLVETCHSESKLNDDRSFTRNCLSAPVRAAANGARAVVMIDGLGNAASLDGGAVFIDDLLEIAGRSNVTFVLCGPRRQMFGRGSFDVLEIEVFPAETAGAVVERLAAKYSIAINDQTRDLIATQTGGRVKFIDAVLAGAGKDLSTFERVQGAHTNEIFGGRVSKYLDATFAGSTPATLKLLGETLNSPNGRLPLAYWQRHAELSSTELDSLLVSLHASEIVNLSTDHIAIDANDTVVCDYIRARHRIEIDGQPRGMAVGLALAENVKRAPQLMARLYRKTAAIDLRELLVLFDGRSVSSAVIDYTRFKTELKGADAETVRENLAVDDKVLRIPHMVYAAHTSAFYPQFSEVCETERSAIALGFSDDARHDETAWIAAEIDSKLEAKGDLTAFWCDRLEMAAEASELASYRIWLIAPEGFDDEALALLNERNAYGSSRKQVELLKDILETSVESQADDETIDEYEIVVPMGEEAEMLAAQTIDDIAERHAFPKKATNQIKTAVVEACINAAEHSLSPDRKVVQKYAVAADKITITISNRGLRLADKQSPAPDEAASNERRGWGLKLIRGLMDDVKIEETDDGTRITMVKNLAA
ncbi:MAG: ATP-binding protein [Pyrinomonadaceae bacterium]